jgi:hypothetical protein
VPVSRVRLHEDRVPAPEPQQDIYDEDGQFLAPFATGPPSLRTVLLSITLHSLATTSRQLPALRVMCN